MDSVAHVARVLVTTRLPLSRGEIARQSGRSQAAVSAAVDVLESAGLVAVERAALPSSGGRPADRVALRGAGLDVVGLHVSPLAQEEFEVRTLRADLRGEVADESERRWRAASFDEALAMVPEVVRQSSSQDASRTLVGLAVPGVVTEDDEGRGSVAMFSHHLSQPAEIVAVLADRGLAASALNAQDAAAVGELLSPDCVAGSLLYVYWGFGIGSGFAIRSARGYPRTRSGGEIGHLPIALDPTTGKGRQCYCGSFGCLTAHADVLKHLATLGHVARDLSDALQIAATDRAARRDVERMAVLVGAGIAGVVNLTGPDEVVVGGPVPTEAPWVAPIIRSTVVERVLGPHREIEVREDRQSDDSAILGAIDDVRHRFLSNADRTQIANLSVRPASPERGDKPRTFTAP